MKKFLFLIAILLCGSRAMASTANITDSGPATDFLEILYNEWVGTNNSMIISPGNAALKSGKFTNVSFYDDIAPTGNLRFLRSDGTVTVSKDINRGEVYPLLGHNYVELLLYSIGSSQNLNGSVRFWNGTGGQHKGDSSLGEDMPLLVTGNMTTVPSGVQEVTGSIQSRVWVNGNPDGEKEFLSDGTTATLDIVNSACNVLTVQAWNKTVTDHYLFIVNAYSTATPHPSATRKYILPADDMLYLDSKELGPNGLYHSTALSLAISTSMNAFVAPADFADFNLSGTYSTAP